MSWDTDNQKLLYDSLPKVDQVRTLPINHHKIRSRACENSMTTGSRSKRFCATECG